MHMRLEKETSRSACRIEHIFIWLGVGDFNHRLHERPRCEELATVSAKARTHQGLKGVPDYMGGRRGQIYRVEFLKGQSDCVVAEGELLVLTDEVREAITRDSHQAFVRACLSSAE